MDTQTDPPYEATLPAEMDLDGLIATLIRLRNNPDPIARARQARHLNRHVVQGALARAFEDSIADALAVPGAKPGEIARAIGVHPNKVYGRRKPTRGQR